MNGDYMCWRVSGSLDRSIESCPLGDQDTCMSHDLGDTCTLGKTIKL